MQAADATFPLLEPPQWNLAQTGEQEAGFGVLGALTRAVVATFSTILPLMVQRYIFWYVRAGVSTAAVAFAYVPLGQVSQLVFPPVG